jgi:hypothetical protein
MVDRFSRLLVCALCSTFAATVMAQSQYPAPQYPVIQYPATQYPVPQYPAAQYPAPQYGQPQNFSPQYAAPIYMALPQYPPANYQGSVQPYQMPPATAQQHASQTQHFSQTSTALDFSGNRDAGTAVVADGNPSYYAGAPANDPSWIIRSRGMAGDHV